MSNTSDASSIHIKVAQYFVNKKLAELKKKKFHFKDELTDEGLPPQYSWNELPEWRKRQHPPSKLPQYSWDELLERMKHQPRSGEPARVAIIGAGLAGLRTAMLLQKLNIPYKIFEASDRPGGRIFTYYFRSDPDTSPEGNHDYYDVGAMRFPNNNANKPMFDLFEELGFRFRNEECPDGEMIEFKFGIDDNIRHFNSECRTGRGTAASAHRHCIDISTTSKDAAEGFDLFNEGKPLGNVRSFFPPLVFPIAHQTVGPGTVHQSSGNRRAWTDISWSGGMSLQSFQRPAKEACF